MLPGMDGYAICKLMKRDDKLQRIPIVMLTAKGEESDIVTGLELGADDYITKPFSPKVLIARLRTVLRRSNRNEDQKSAVISKHNITIDTARFEVAVGCVLNSTSAWNWRVALAIRCKQGLCVTMKKL